MKLFDISDWCKKGLELKDYPMIGEIDIDDISVSDVIEANEVHYAVGVLDHKSSMAGVREIELDIEGEDRDYESLLTCPYCGYRNSDSFELGDNDGDYSCPRCSGRFSYERIVTIEYSSIPYMPPEVKVANFKSAERPSHD